MRITNLTNKQIKMLDTMWNIDSAYDLVQWQSTLSEDDYRMSVTLQELLLAEYLDDTIIDEDCDETLQYLNSLRHREA